MPKRYLPVLLGIVVILALIAGCAQSAPTSPTAAPVVPTAAPATTAPGSSAPTPVAAAPTVAPTTAAQVPAAAFPVTITDQVGRTVTIDKAPVNIVSLAPSNTEILLALGLGEQVVGVTDFCDYPAEAKEKPKIGGVEPSLEKIVAAKPDLVFAVSYTQGAPDAVQKLDGLGIKSVVLGPKDLQGIYDSIVIIGKATGKVDEADALMKQVQTEISVVADKAKSAPKVRVMYELDATDPAKPYVPGPGSFIDGMLALAGGDNIGADAKLEWAQLSLEEVVKKDPEVIILGDANYGVSPDQVKARPGWSGITAIKEGAVFGIDDNLVSRPGPRVGEGLAALAKLIHPELFN